MMTWLWLRLHKGWITAYKVFWCRSIVWSATEKRMTRFGCWLKRETVERKTWLCNRALRWSKIIDHLKMVKVEIWAESMGYFISLEKQNFAEHTHSFGPRCILELFSTTTLSICGWCWVFRREPGSEDHPPPQNWYFCYSLETWTGHPLPTLSQIWITCSLSGKRQWHTGQLLGNLAAVLKQWFLCCCFRVWCCFQESVQATWPACLWPERGNRSIQREHWIFTTFPFHSDRCKCESMPVWLAHHWRSTCLFDLD